MNDRSCCSGTSLAATGSAFRVAGAVVFAVVYTLIAMAAVSVDVCVVATHLPLRGEIDEQAT